MAEDSAAEDHSDRLEGRYANLFRVGHNAFEVIVEFGQFYKGNQHPVMHTKIVTSPAYAKALLGLLESFAEEYEKTFGPIAVPNLDE